MKKSMMAILFCFLFVGLWNCKLNINNILDEALTISMSVSRTSVAPSEEITLTATVYNRGLGSSVATTLRWYHSTDSTISSSDTLVGTDVLSSLSSFGSSTKTISITVPNTTNTYYYGVCVDSVKGESRIDNNCSSAVKVVVLVSTHSHLPTSDFTPHSNAGNNNPIGIWSDGTTMWIVNDGRLDAKLYAYDLVSKARNTNEDITTLRAAGNIRPIGIWSDGTTMWIADTGEDKLYAYDLVSKLRNTNEDFNTLSAAGNNAPCGIWSDGTTMWVADYLDEKLYAYSMSNKISIPAKDFTTLRAAGNRDPRGIWSDGTTMWVADNQDTKLYAYDLASKAHVPAKDFNTLQATGNRYPTGIWSDGTTMWVVDTDDAKLYAYDAQALVNTGE